MYVALQRLTEEGLLEEAEAGTKVYEDRRSRRHYRLSEFGREVCRAEAQRLAEEVRAAIDKNLLDPASVRLT